MSWFLISLMCAVAEAVKDAASKVALRAGDAVSVALVSFLISYPLFLYEAAGEAIPELDWVFIAALVGHVSLFTFSTYLYQRALAASDISLAVPLICFTPIFFLFTSPLITNEYFSAAGAIGAVFVVAGAYSLYLPDSSAGFLGPVRNLARDEGARLMLVVAFIWSITGNLDRLGVRHSSRAFWIAAELTLIVLVFLAARIGLRKRDPLFTPVNLAVGFFNGISIYLYIWAVSIQKVGYVVSVKRVSVLLAVLIGHFVFREANVRARLFGSLLLLAGVVIISLGK